MPGGFKEMSITKKEKLGQLLCRHKNTGWYVEKSRFQSLKGEKQYKVCEGCGKILGEKLLEYEGMGFK